MATDRVHMYNLIMVDNLSAVAGIVRPLLGSALAGLGMAQPQTVRGIALSFLLVLVLLHVPTVDLIAIVVMLHWTAGVVQPLLGTALAGLGVSQPQTVGGSTLS